MKMLHEYPEKRHGGGRVSKYASSNMCQLTF